IVTASTLLRTNAETSLATTQTEFAALTLRRFTLACGRALIFVLRRISLSGAQPPLHHQAQALVPSANSVPPDGWTRILANPCCSKGVAHMLLACEVVLDSARLWQFQRSPNTSRALPV